MNNDDIDAAAFGIDHLVFLIEASWTSERLTPLPDAVAVLTNIEPPHRSPSWHG